MTTLIPLALAKECYATRDNDCLPSYDDILSRFPSVPSKPRSSRPVPQPLCLRVTKRQSKTEHVPESPATPCTDMEWKATLGEIKREYMNRRFRQCSTRCHEVLAQSDKFVSCASFCLNSRRICETLGVVFALSISSALILTLDRKLGTPHSPRLRSLLRRHGSGNASPCHPPLLALPHDPPQTSIRPLQHRIRPRHPSRSTSHRPLPSRTQQQILLLKTTLPRRLQRLLLNRLHRNVLPEPVPLLITRG